MDIETFYRQATNYAPYPYQKRLAEVATLPQVLNVPTGVGKTAAAVLSWLYRRRIAADHIRSTTPRRLAYCLPMRTLVEQTQATVKNWLTQLRMDDADNGGVGVHLLMGGADDGRWYEHPERDAILIGTQDMLLSRALNRGYGMSRYAWPVQYALLNNDCLWVLDETQLMGVGLTTSAQLSGLREKLGVYSYCPIMWMSATLNENSLHTIDHPLPESGKWLTETIQEDDQADPSVKKLLSAPKPCKQATVSFTSVTKNTYKTLLAELILEAHQSNTLTLIVLNRVQRVQETFKAIQKQIAKKEDAPEIQIIHSRFRPHERQEIQKISLDDKNIPVAGRILIASQAIEAGVDISSTTLITELAPWSSLVQRFGRCNRRGLCGDGGNPVAQVLWIDIDTSDSMKAVEAALPYSQDELDRARETISNCEDVGPASLREIIVEETQALVHVIRRKDLLDLYDTTPDLSGNDLDVSRYIRDSEENDVQVYWRDWELISSRKTSPPIPDRMMFPAPIRQELCSVSVKQFRTFHGQLQKKDKTKFLCWIWNSLDRIWEACTSNSIQPGQTILLHVSAGGYDPEQGWTGDPTQGPVTVCPLSGNVEINAAMDQDNQGDKPLTVKDHLKDVGMSAEELRAVKAKDWDKDIPWDCIIRAAWWHDVGKSHPAFQGAMHRANVELNPEQLWAKSGATGYLDFQILPEDEEEEPQKRPGFRHELASALAWLQQHDGEADADLVAYLIAAHHGKVRLSIRSMPNEVKPSEADQLFGRGIWQHDELPHVEIGNELGEVSEALSLDLSLMQLGEYIDQQGQPRASWLTRALQLREAYGPFKLAYLETLVRVADWRGSNSGRKS
ncbi:CRISPR-associated nuclease/helicase Cas3 [Gimesia panareensis]|uniref:CRISPR-associated nuclease/helicase Cas3 n=1 Tax=Gimesia panareensis TaxID=2527978 RepID=A0A518FW73_9PLAN|nr:CRISPR-associated endonuclease Cas3'' [Gimesia panareensis]QDV20613.1 CRISPR-associated nuclease/helicase Cas3 [Gimesia panareensis]